MLDSFADSTWLLALVLFLHHLLLLLVFILIHIPLVRLVSPRLVVVFYYDNCLPSARVTVRP